MAPAPTGCDWLMKDDHDRELPRITDSYCYYRFMVYMYFELRSDTMLYSSYIKKGPSYAPSGSRSLTASRLGTSPGL
jgi:hypothetical protein